MDNMLKYNGYHGSVEFSFADKCFYGKVFGINALITYEGDSVASIETAFRESVDSYLDLCVRNSIKPEKEYSGQIKFRPGATLHRQLNMSAKKKGISINSLIIEACRSYIGNSKKPDITINFPGSYYLGLQMTPKRTRRLDNVLQFPANQKGGRV